MSVLEVVAGELVLLAPAGWARDEARVYLRLHGERVGIKAAAAVLGNRHRQPPPNGDHVSIPVEEQGHAVEPPGRVLEGMGKRLWPLYLEPLLRDVRDPDQHIRNFI